MPYTVTIAMIKDGFNSPVSDADLTGYIAIVDQADTCLTNNSVPDAIGVQLKLLAIRHLATNQRDGGSVTSERAVSGASRSYANYRAGDTGFLETLRQLDRWGCVRGVVEQNARLQLRSIGRRPERRSTY